MNHPVKNLTDAITKALPNIITIIDHPKDPNGHWFVDFVSDKHRVIVEWRLDHGFGISSSMIETGYGEGPNEVSNNVEETANIVLRLLTK